MKKFEKYLKKVNHLTKPKLVSYSGRDGRRRLCRRHSSTKTVPFSPVRSPILPPSSPSSPTTTPSSSSSFPFGDLELLSIKPASRSYTSLKDLLLTVAVNSPNPNSAHQAQPDSDICIQNYLVKQAAWAYLQPMSTSPASADDNFFHRFWPRVASFFDFVRRSFIRAVGWTLQVFSIRSSR
ncbi:hypothetical protein PHJA_000464100 [Phtheirospermum japonicum]|uniref:Uncharacterized protein n=1 Tax=Phtheirospermum japonicum TaxID=374723 RepID=A0A830B7Z0_9LAMI|nr:hypothetical protein PHJA_000464100 [Phtheirospermum japonicum]